VERRRRRERTASSNRRDASESNSLSPQWGHTSNSTSLTSTVRPRTLAVTVTFLRRIPTRPQVGHRRIAMLQPSTAFLDETRM
jgi:hypothetical protein